MDYSISQFGSSRCLAVTIPSEATLYSYIGNYELKEILGRAMFRERSSSLQMLYNFEAYHAKRIILLCPHLGEFLIGGFTVYHSLP